MGTFEPLEVLAIVAAVGALTASLVEITLGRPRRLLAIFEMRRVAALFQGGNGSKGGA